MQRTQNFSHLSITFCQLFTPYTLTYWLAQLPIWHNLNFQDSLYLTWLALPTAHIFRFFSLIWDCFPSISQNMFLDLISLSLFLRLGIQLCFTASMPAPLFTANQICYHPLLPLSLTNSTLSSDLYHCRHHTISLSALSSVTVSLKLYHHRSQDRHRFVSLFLCLFWASICLLQV